MFALEQLVWFIKRGFDEDACPTCQQPIHRVKGYTPTAGVIKYIHITYSTTNPNGLFRYTLNTSAFDVHDDEIYETEIEAQEVCARKNKILESIQEVVACEGC